MDGMDDMDWMDRGKTLRSCWLAQSILSIASIARYARGLSIVVSESA